MAKGKKSNEVIIANNELAFQNQEKEKRANEVINANKALVASENRYRRLFEAAQDGILILNAETGVIEDVNPFMIEMLGYSYSEFLSKELWEIGLLSDIHANKQAFLKLKEEGYIRYKDLPLKTKNGLSISVEFVSNRYDVSGGQVIQCNIRNITERKIAENAVKESEAQYRAFFENSMDGILLTVTDGEILAANPAACKIFNMTEQEICDAGRFGLVDLSDPRVENLIKERQLTGKAQGELTLLRKDGTTFAGEISSVLFADSFGQERTSMIIRDISARKEAEERLALTSGKLQSTLNDLKKMMDSSLDVICAVDAQGMFLKVSAASETVWGYKPEELVGKPIFDIVYSEDIKKTQLSAVAVMSGNNLNHFENRYVRKDGSLVPIEWSARWDAKDQIRYGVARDVTEKKRLEKVVESERQRFYHLFSEAPSSMGVLSGPDHVFEIVNPLYLQLIGKKDIIGKTVKEVLPEAVDQGFIELLDEVYKTGETFSANEMLIQLDLHGTGKLVDTYLNFIYQAHRDDQNEINGILFFAIDVTEQVISRKTIEESERKLKEAQAIARISNWEINLETNTHQWSAEFYDIMRIKPEEVKPSAEAFLSLLHPDDVEQANESIQNTFDTFQESFFYSRINTNDGIVRYVYSEWKFEFDKTNKPIRLYGILQDVTEKKLAEERLIKSNRFYAFISAINHSIVHIKEEEALLKKACSIGMEIGKFKTAWIGLLNEEDKLEVINFGRETAITQIVEKRSGMDVENSPFRNTGVGKALRNGIYAVSNDVLNDPDMHFLKEELLNTGIRANIVFPIKKSGKVTGVFSFNSDTVNFFDEEEILLLQEATNNISFAIESFDKAKQHKKAEEKIIESEMDIRTMAESMPQIVWKTTAEGKNIYFNQQWVDYTGLTLEESYGDGWLIPFHKDDKPLAWSAWNSAVINLVEYTVECRLRKYDGSYHWWLMRGVPKINERGEIEKWFGTCTNIEKIKQTEERLKKQASDLALSNAELEQFAYVASHDLQEPLRMITSFLRKLEQKYEGIIDEKGKQYIFFAVDGAVRMRKIILDLLKFSRVSRIDEQLENIDLNVLVDGVQKLLSNQIDEKKAVFEIKKLPTIAFYKSPLVQIFQNLISNALKYTKADVSPRISIACKENESDWEISVTDNGIGISEEHFDKIFILFQRLHNKNEYSGTGIGLSITKKIIEKQGSKIWVESELEKGSTFYFTIPKKLK